MALRFEALSHIAGNPAINRLSYVLWSLTVRTLTRRPHVGGEVLPIPLTQLHLAAATALTPVHVNRTLRWLRDGGILDFHDHRLTILDDGALEAMAGVNEDFVAFCSRAP